MFQVRSNTLGQHGRIVAALQHAHEAALGMGVGDPGHQSTEHLKVFHFQPSTSRLNRPGLGTLALALPAFRWYNGTLHAKFVWKQENTAMPKLDYRNIEVDPSRCGGQPVVTGTRIRVATILNCYRQRMSVEEITQQYLPLKPADVHDALAFAYDHIEELEADLAADDAASVKQHQTDDGSS